VDPSGTVAYSDSGTINSFTQYSLTEDLQSAIDQNKGLRANLLNLMNNTEKFKLFLKSVQKFGGRQFGEIRQEYRYRGIYNFNIPLISRCKGDEGSKRTCQNSTPVITKPPEYTYIVFGLTIRNAVVCFII
jgi:hypothetical protein